MLLAKFTTFTLATPSRKECIHKKTKSVLIHQKLLHRPALIHFVILTASCKHYCEYSKALFQMKENQSI